jgi:hypothetical protein
LFERVLHGPIDCAHVRPLKPASTTRFRLQAHGRQPEIRPIAVDNRSDSGYAFNDAIRVVDALNFANGFGHKDWHVPTKNELNVLFNNRAAIGGFDISGSNPSGWYWSSSFYDKWNAWGQRFSDGFQNDFSKVYPSSVRCVR